MKVRNKKVILIVSSLLVTSGLVVGCADKKSEQNTNTTNNEQSLQTTKEDYTYENNEYFTSADWLNKNLSNKNVLIIDARSEDDYNKGHIPEAINVAWQSFCKMEGKAGDKDWGTLLDKDQLSKIYSDLGIDKIKSYCLCSEKWMG